jgi:uncharacterized protein
VRDKLTSQRERGKEYFYRAVDKQVKAMSPMFLGGLTALAIKLKDEASTFQVALFETYPALFVQHFNLSAHYHKKDISAIPLFIDQLLAQFSIQVSILQLPTWHHVDALIAWYSCYRMAHDQHITFGDDEGQIFI